MGALGLVLAVPGALAGLVWLAVPNYDSSGLDFEVPSPPVALQILAGVLPIATVVLLVLTVYWARKRWAGYLLLALGLSMIIGIIGLFFQGIL